MMNKRILVVDPILRGSRLVYSSHTLSAAIREGWEAHLLTRREAVTNHYEELLGGSSHQLHAVLAVPPDVWYDKLSASVIRSCLAEIEQLAARHHLSAVFFMGWNEFFPALPCLRLRHAPLRKLHSWAIDYAPAYWLKPGQRLDRQRLQVFAKRLISRIALKRFTALRFLLPDERVLDPGLSELPARLRDRFAWIPDPAPDPRPSEVKENRPAKMPEVLVVGLQTERKGLLDVVELVERTSPPPPFHFHFVGRLGSDTEYLRARLKKLPPDRFSWDEGFFSEEVIQGHYAAADFVILPYTRGFDCTSAVLASSCSFGKPVIATDHGLIGFRVRQHSLGFVYPSRETGVLDQTLKKVPLPGEGAYQALVSNCRNFAAANSVKAYQGCIVEAVRKASGD